MSKINRLKESSNPFFSERAMQRAQGESHEAAVSAEETMSVSGAINKSFILFAILLSTTVLSYQIANPILTIGGAIGGLIVVFLAVFKPSRAVWAAPLYAAVEGLFVGGITYMFASMYSGIVFKAVMLTFGVLFTMLFIYKTEIIKVTDKFRRGVVMATGAVLLVYVVNLVLGFFGMSLPFLHEGGWLSIVVSLVIIGIASLNLLLDFDFIEKGEEQGLPEYMEWFGAMGLLITLVWLYVEILRLLAMLAGNE
ncbi:MAG TPA: Bax inhibitor-1/YccA family protein [Saprospiraceae bacterium]|nr:Bax inhibitor-1/YccA family protein [Saprospiraceae bacterium]